MKGVFLGFLGGVVLTVLSLNVLPSFSDTDNETQINQTLSTKSANRIKSNKSPSFRSQLNKIEENVGHSLDFYSLNCEDPLEKALIENYLRELAKRSADEAISKARSISDSTCGNMALKAVYEELVKSSPRETADRFLNEELLLSDREALLGFVRAFGKINPEEAIVFIDHLDYHFRDEATGALIQAWGEIDPIKALEFGLGQHVKESVYTSLKTLGKSLALKDPSLVLDHINEFSISYNRDKFLQGFFDEWSQQDPESAALGLETLSNDKRFNSNIYQNVGMNYGYQPEKGKEWVVSIDDSREKRRASRYFTSTWASQDPEAASEWAHSLSDSDVYDQAAWSLAQAYLIDDTEYAMEWSNSIGLENMRMRNMMNIYQHWENSAPSEAERWIQSTDLLSPSEKEAIKSFQ